MALTLSDSFCVDRYRDEFLDLMRKGTVDLVFANEAELHSLYQTSDFDTALKQLRADTKLGVVTRSEKGCVVAAKDGVTPCRRSRSKSWWTRPAPATCSPPASCSAWCATRAMKTAGRLGALAAAEVIQHIGARPQVSLKELARQNGLPV